MPSPIKQPNRESELHDIVRSSPDLAPSTKDRYLRDLNYWIDFAGADPKGWTVARAQAFHESLLARMQPQSAARMLASLQYAARRWSQVLDRPELNFAPKVIAFVQPKADTVIGSATLTRVIVEGDTLIQEFTIVDGPRQGQTLTLRTRANKEGKRR